MVDDFNRADNTALAYKHGRQMGNLARCYITTRARLRLAEEALRKMASFNDEGANAHLQRTGSYGRFDEPASVKLSRETLEKL